MNFKNSHYLLPIYILLFFNFLINPEVFGLFSVSLEIRHNENLLTTVFFKR